MRKFVMHFVTAVAVLGSTAAQAADLDYGVLRGPDEDVYIPPVDWSGVYIGGHGGYTSAAYGFGTSGRDIAANALRRTVIETELSVSNLLRAGDVREGERSYGAFAGYNIQLDDIVVGIEADYTRFDTEGRSSDAISRQSVTSNGFQNFYSLSSLSSTKVRDYGTVRARAGVAFGSFMPFVTAGAAIGRAQISDVVGIQSFGYDANALANGAPVVNSYGYSSFNRANVAGSVPAPTTFYGREKTKVVGGVSLGGGIEYAITPNILLRGEYQYVLFNDFDGHKVNLNTVRGGAAVKF